MALQAILEHLDVLEPLCAELSPLSPHTSPRSRRLASTICERVGSIHAAVTNALLATPDEAPQTPATGNSPALRPSSSRDDPLLDDDDDDNGEQQDGLEDTGHDEVHLQVDSQEHRDVPVAHDKASAKEAALATRMAAVLAAPNPPSLVDVAEVLFGLHMRHKTAALEDLAFGRLLRILPLGSLHDWSETFTTHADDITGITRIVAQSAAYDGLDDITARLCSRYTGIAANEAGSETYNVVVSVLLQIETVKFAIDWEARRALPGGKKWIGAFFKLMFMQDPSYADAFAGLTERQAEKRFTELKEVYSKWRNKAGHVVTARNRLLKLYNTFGPAVFLDPTWTADGLVHHRSRLFVPLCDQVRAHIASANVDLLPLRQRAHHTLVHIMIVLGGRTVGTHVDRFLNDTVMIKSEV